MRRKKSNSNWSIVILIALLFIVIGTVVYLIQYNNENKQKNTTTNNATENNNQEEETKQETKEEPDKTEYKENEEFKNQEGDNVEISGDKIVSATGFAGASNYKFYLRNGTLYFRNISKDTEEEIIATGVKDLYLENKEVTAELTENGKIVKENNYITYK